MPTASGLCLRRADNRDLLLFEASGLTVPGTSWSEDDYRGELALRDSYTWVLVPPDAASSPSRLLGVLVFRVCGGEIELMQVGVDPTERRRGLGKCLLDHLLAQARDLDARRIWLEVSEGNRAARALYVRCGFVVVGRRRRYYRDGSDAMLMELPLASGEAL